MDANNDTKQEIIVREDNKKRNKKIGLYIKLVAISGLVAYGGGRQLYLKGYESGLDKGIAIEKEIEQEKEEAEAANKKKEDNTDSFDKVYRYMSNEIVKHLDGNAYECLKLWNDLYSLTYSDFEAGVDEEDIITKGAIDEFLIKFDYYVKNKESGIKPVDDEKKLILK